MSIIDGIKSNARTARWVGIFLVIAGVVSLFAPLAAGAALATMVGLLLAFGGISLLVLAFRAGSFGDGMMIFLIGALTLVAGIYMMAEPGGALIVMTVFLAMYFAVTGIVEIIYALRLKPVQGWGWLVFGGIVSLLLGIMMWRQMPLTAAWAIGVLVGIRLIMSGFQLLAIGGAAGDVANAMDDAASA
ncbi:MAG: DUF308 domain-containing protein [Gemmatimonadota bacterium]